MSESQMAKREPPSDLLGALLDSLIEAKRERERRGDNEEVEKPNDS